MAHDLALVLGGGGAAGHAWTIGVVAGLADGGLDLTEADLVIGTSSGATAAAWVCGGTPPAELYASVLAEPSGPGERRGGGPPPAPTEGFERLRAIGAAATTADELRGALGSFALERDAAHGPETASRRRALVASRLPSPDWPDRPMIVVAVEASTGEPAAFDRDSGVDLADAITASTALPGMAPTVEINGTRYISGGARSTNNADLAAGYAHVVVLTPLSGRTGPLPPGQFEGIRRFPEDELESQVERLRTQGSRVDVITPDADSVAAMGVNQMDPATRLPSARAGFAQGLDVVSRLRR